MSTTDHDAVVAQPALDLDAIFSGLDSRTAAILEQRQKKGGVRRRGWLVRRLLLAADIIGLGLAFIVANFVFSGSAGADHLDDLIESGLFVSVLPIWIIAAKLHGLYDRDEERTDHSTADDLLGVLHVVTLGTWIVYAVATLSGIARPELSKVVLFWGVAVVLIPFARVGSRAVARRRVAYLQNTIVVGAGQVGQLVARKFLQHPEYGINLVGFVDSDPRETGEAVTRVRVLGRPDQLPALVRFFDIERVVLAFSRESHEDVLQLIRSMKDLDVQIDIVPRYFEIVGPGVNIHTVEGLPLMGLPSFRLARSSRLLKRATDLVLSTLALILLAPMLGLIALWIKFDSAGPIFFRQERRGAKGRIFRIYKFRTMVADADRRKIEFAHLNQHARDGGDPRMFKIASDPRVTRFGRVLRRYSLDELPQVLNVFKGEMSLVGPRPLILEEDVYVATWARRRLDLKPGITGVWQVLGASDIPFEEMTRLDYLYVMSWSPWNDLRLMMRTIPAVFRSRQSRAY